jgi:hypothetical protein
VGPLARRQNNLLSAGGDTNINSHQRMSNHGSTVKTPVADFVLLIVISIFDLNLKFMTPKRKRLAPL